MTPEIQRKLDEEEHIMMKKAEIDYNLSVSKGVTMGDFLKM